MRESRCSSTAEVAAKEDSVADTTAKVGRMVRKIDINVMSEVETDEDDFMN